MSNHIIAEFDHEQERLLDSFIQGRGAISLTGYEQWMAIYQEAVDRAKASLKRKNGQTS